MDDPASNPPVDEQLGPYNGPANQPIQDVSRADSPITNTSVAGPSHPDPLRYFNHERYFMSNHRRGVAAIFNQMKFEECGIKEREGSQHDVACLSKSFSQLGFQIEIYNDLGLPSLETTLDNLRGRDHSDSDCFVLIFMSHGIEDKLRCRDGVFDLNLLWDSFTDERCPSLAYKPKLFFIQASQGETRHNAVRVVEAPPELVKLVPPYSLPDQAHFLIMLATTPGCPSYQFPRGRSVFIHELCTRLDILGAKEEIMHLLTVVARNVATKHTYRDKENEVYFLQLPLLISFLTRRLTFTKKKGVTIYTYND